MARIRTYILRLTPAELATLRTVLEYADDRFTGAVEGTETTNAPVRKLAYTLAQADVSRIKAKVIEAMP